jgi:hypothetical protein
MIDTMKKQDNKNKAPKNTTLSNALNEALVEAREDEILLEKMNEAKDSDLVGGDEFFNALDE